MMTPSARSSVFRYLAYDLSDAGLLRCRYALDEQEFEERIAFAGPSLRSATDAVQEAARLVHLLAGVSYYKAGAPPTIDLQDTPIRPGEREFLHSYYLNGLGEFAYRNSLELDLRIEGGADAPQPVRYQAVPHRPLIPFGGGMDSIVAVETVRATDSDPSLFIVSRAGDHFAAIEDAAAATQLPILRADRELDAKILRSPELGYLNGHVPVTGVLSAIAIMVALANDRDAVVMSNEWSASVGTLNVNGRTINHQYSKSAEFENGFRGVLARAFDPAPEFFSLLRPWSELAIAERFASLDRYHSVFRSCNRAFHINPAERLATWCGKCDKCCFIDLVLAPFMTAEKLAEIYCGREPLTNPDLLGNFRTLLALSGEPKPFECVGDVDECRTAAALASRRADRKGCVVLNALVAELGGAADTAYESASQLRLPLGDSNIPPSYATARLVG